MSPSPIDPAAAEKWEVDFVPPWQAGPSRPPSISDSSGSHCDGNDDDIDMLTPSTSFETDTSVDDVTVQLIGSGGGRFALPKSDIYEHSATLFDQIVWSDDQPHINIHFPDYLAKTLADTIKPVFVCPDYWENFRLEDLLRMIEIYVYYGLGEWHLSNVENEILERLGDKSCFGLNDVKLARELHQLATDHGLGLILRTIEHSDVLGLISACYVWEDGERPRKWRKISIK
ncbi:hypothetical protein sr12329 [Sporisorium reilianum SRZ2]|uniref:BTB domain-containing protein n=1 Tax=Sporisorium reilianum (strain SRZ2) TaxID=999809 RepID=E6ZT75_SPORE|nr:hypothetical protein sr12329 [Sporisorium reilianum SRZ2]